MTIRVTDSEVFEIIDTSLTNIDPFINSASLIVDGYLLSKGLSDEILKQIELYIAAHLLSLKDPRTKSVRVDVLSESYQGQWGLGLNGTSYGQTAILLDSSGTLGALTKNGKITTSFGVIGYHE